MSEQTQVALQEWAVICASLGRGELELIVRKGGIHERRGGLFTLEHQRFALLPTYEHQSAERLRAGYAAEIAANPHQHEIEIRHWAQAEVLWRVEGLELVQSLELPWTAEELKTRFYYRNEAWLAVVALRVHAFPAPVRLPTMKGYGGCRSWIDLAQALNTTGSQPVISDAAWAKRLRTIAEQLEQT